MTKEEFASYMDLVYTTGIKKLREAGQKEYAGGEDAHGNFNRLAERLQLSPEKVLMVYLSKHLDGIDAYINGHKSQREGVHGRIEDAIVYLFLLHSMIEAPENGRL